MHEQSCVQCYHINVHLTVVSVEGFPLPFDSQMLECPHIYSTVYINVFVVYIPDRNIKGITNAVYI